MNDVRKGINSGSVNGHIFCEHYVGFAEKVSPKFMKRLHQEVKEQILLLRFASIPILLLVQVEKNTQLLLNQISIGCIGLEIIF